MDFYPFSADSLRARDWIQDLRFRAKRAMEMACLLDFLVRIYLSDVPACLSLETDAHIMIFYVEDALIVGGAVHLVL